MEAAEREWRLRRTSQISADSSTRQEIVEKWNFKDGNKVILQLQKHSNAKYFSVFTYTFRRIFFKKIKKHKDIFFILKIILKNKSNKSKFTCKCFY